ncbi:NhaA Na+/H+ antiporter [actinobacterium SCGC AAA044-D11]
MEFMATARDWITTGPLVLFFFLAGIELRAELLDGAFRKRFSFLIPFAAAMGGMIAPALIYFIIAKNTSAPESAWGVPMATDLPLALLALSLLAKSVSNRIRGFLLALAIADDLGSILVVAVVYHHHIEVVRLVISALLLLLFWKIAPRFPIVAVLIGLLTWGVFKESGIHPTVIGVLLGLAINHNESQWLVKRLTPVINYLVIPAFIVTTLWIPWKISTALIFSPVVLGLVIARLIGKPLGIWLFATIAMKTMGHKVISGKDLFLVGTLGTIGLSVSMLFANLAELGSNLNGVLLGTLITLPAALVLILLSAQLLRASRIQERNQEY